MSVTYPKVVFGDLTFEGDEILTAIVVEEFDPISAKLPAGSLDITLYSSAADFSALNPYRSQEYLDSKQPLSVYEIIDGREFPIGLFFLDEWETTEDTMIKFKCIDQIGLLETHTFNGGIWTTPVTVAALLAQITEISGVDFEIDPDVIGTTVKGWLPICNCREALQQIVFAAGLYALAARQDGFINISQLINSNQIITRGIVSGVAAVGESKIRQRKWRPAQWSLSTISEIDETQISVNRPVTQKIGVTGVEICAHNYTADAATTAVELFKDTLTVGTHKITFDKPHHTLNVTGATESESNANYIIVIVAVEGTVTITGKPHTDSIVIFEQHLSETEMGQKKINVVKVDEAFLVNSSNGAEVAERVFEYHQLRFLQKCRLYAPLYIQAGSEVYIDTLYTQTLRGWVERMSIDLAGGFRIDADVVGDIQIPIYEIYCGITATGESSIRQRNFRPSIGFQ